MKYEKIFSERITLLRKTKQLKQEELGRAIHLTKSTISRIESGDRSVSVDTLLALADYFSVSVDYLTGRSSDPTIHNPIAPTDEEAAVSKPADI
jgi:transcriptional regulator with XRE-family HTH domain